MTIRIERVANPGETERAAILKPLRAYNLSQAGSSAPESFALLVHDEQSGEIVGGLSGSITYRWLFIELLAIQPHTRNDGTGSRLLTMAEEIAREQGCIGMWLDTFDFQAPAFYEKHGFSKFGQLEDFPLHHARFFYQKRL